MIPLFFGHDERARAGSTVFTSSVLERATEPVALCPLTRRNLPGVREGSNTFTYRRFLVPFQCGYEGWAIFADGADMLCRVDIAELWRLRDARCAVQVVKHDYLTRHPLKYVGAAMQSSNRDYERKQWASLMLINCEHSAWGAVTAGYLNQVSGLHALQLRFLPNSAIGELPREWNWLADEHGDNPDAKIVHYTAGIPAFAAHAHAPMAQMWRDELARATEATG